MTAGELMDELALDFNYQRMARERDRQAEHAEASAALEERPVVAALRKYRPTLQSLWELDDSLEPYPELIPTLLEHLRKDYPDRVRESIARALAVPYSRSGWRLLVEQYLRAPGSRGKDELKYLIAVALSAAADRPDCDELVALVRNRRHGGSRIGLLHGIVRLLRDDARPLLQDLVADPAVKAQATEMLRRLDRNIARRRKG